MVRVLCHLPPFRQMSPSASLRARFHGGWSKAQSNIAPAPPSADAERGPWGRSCQIQRAAGIWRPRSRLTAPNSSQPEIWQGRRPIGAQNWLRPTHKEGSSRGGVRQPGGADPFPEWDEGRWPGRSPARPAERNFGGKSSERLPKEPLRCCPGEAGPLPDHFCHVPRASITPAAPATLTQPTHDLAPGAAMPRERDIACSLPDPLGALKGLSTINGEYSAISCG